VNIGGDYEIGRSICPCVRLCVCVHDDWAGTVALSCEHFYIGGDMHSHERLLHCASKNIPNIFDRNLKKDYRILIIFGRNIPETTGHQKVIYFPTSPNVCSCTTWGNQNQQNITLLPNAILLLNPNNAQKHILLIFL